MVCCCSGEGDATARGASMVLRPDQSRTKVRKRANTRAGMSTIVARGSERPVSVIPSPVKASQGKSMWRHRSTRQRGAEGLWRQARAPREEAAEVRRFDLAEFVRDLRHRCLCVGQQAARFEQPFVLEVEHRQPRHGRGGSGGRESRPTGPHRSPAADDAVALHQRVAQRLARPFGLLRRARTRHAAQRTAQRQTLPR